MKKLSIPEILWYHLYPGVLLTLFFVGLGPVLSTKGIPPQLVLLAGIPIVLIPVMYLHLRGVKKKEMKAGIHELVPYREELPKGKLFAYVLGLIVFAFLVYGVTQPLNAILSEHFWSWLPQTFQIQDFQGYSQKMIGITLIINLILNGLVAPLAEELYFRGYLLPRMTVAGRYAPLVSTLLFSVYHFWQPQIYLTLIIALFPMIYLTWRLKSIKLAIYTHCGLNLAGALLSFGLLFQ